MAKNLRDLTLTQAVAGAVLYGCAAAPASVNTSVDFAQIESCLKTAYSLLTDRMRVVSFNQFPGKAVPMTDDSFTEFVSTGDGKGDWVDIKADGSRRLSGKNVIKGAQVFYSVLNEEGGVDIKFTFNVESCRPRGTGYEFAFTVKGPLEPGGPPFEGRGIIGIDKNAYRMHGISRRANTDSPPVWTIAGIALPAGGE